MRAILIQTDFGPDHLSASAMVGVCRGVCPELPIYEATHMIRQFDVLNASDALMYNLPFWKETVFVSVVDPGVGTARKACVALLKDGNYVVTPDNGTLTHLSRSPGIAAVREIDESVNRLRGSESFSVFHGRDIFAYTAARLASGAIDFEGVGPSYPAEDVVLLEDALRTAEVREGAVSGIVISANDPFGSIVFNITLPQVAEAGFRHGDTLHVRLTHGGRPVFQGDVLYHKSFGYVDEGAPILFNASAGYLSLGLNQASFAAQYRCGRGGDWEAEITRVPAEGVRP